MAMLSPPAKSALVNEAKDFLDANPDIRSVGGSHQRRLNGRQSFATPVWHALWHFERPEVDVA